MLKYSTPKITFGITFFEKIPYNLVLRHIEHVCSMLKIFNIILIICKRGIYDGMFTRAFSHIFGYTISPKSLCHQFRCTLYNTMKTEI